MESASRDLRRSGLQPVDEQVLKQILADYEARVPVFDIGQKHGMSKQRVRALLVYSGVEIRGRGQPGGKKRGQIGENKVDTARAANMARGGLPIDEAVKRLETTRRRLLDAMRTDGYDPIHLWKLRGWWEGRRPTGRI